MRRGKYIRRSGDVLRMRKEIIELLRSCATDLPKDVERALLKSREREAGNARQILGTLLLNTKVARKGSYPICQDTGTPIFYVTTPARADREWIRTEIIQALKDATKAVPLRPNAVDPVSGVNSGDNIGENFPIIHFSVWDKKKVKVELMLKGGGSENVTQLYNLPDTGLKAGRDMDGVSRCVLDASHNAQGKGCPPYIIGVGVGGLADTAISLSKKQLLRKLDDVNSDLELQRLEKDLLKKINSLGIGPMGLAGRTTALAVKVGKQHRHPASYFVAVSFMCWACRRHSIEVAL
jgi:fumarate hydratase, class I